MAKTAEASLNEGGFVNETTALHHGEPFPRRRQDDDLARLTRFYLDRGQKAGLVTNDQVQNTVGRWQFTNV